MNDKIIQRAVAKSIVWDTSDIIKLVSKYETVDKNTNYEVLLSKIQNLLATNSQFANKFTAFLIKKKRLADYNTENAIGTAIVGALTTVTNTVVTAVSAKEQREHETEMVAAQNTQQIMNMMMQEEQARQDKSSQDNMLIIAAVAGMILITGLNNSTLWFTHHSGSLSMILIFVNVILDFI